MAWLLRDADVLAAIEDRRAGWAGIESGAVILDAPLFLLHTFGGVNGLDVAVCVPAEPLSTPHGGRCLDVRRIATLAPHRIGRPVLSRSVVIVAGAGAFERWRLKPGDRLEVRRA